MKLRASSRIGPIVTFGIGVAFLLVGALFRSTGSQTLHLIAAMAFVWGLSALCYSVWDAVGFLRRFR